MHYKVGYCAPIILRMLTERKGKKKRNMPKTYVSNAFKMSVYAKVIAEPENVASRETEIAGNATGFGASRRKSETYETMKQNGFTRILSGDSIGFDPYCPKNVSVTIFDAEERLICSYHSLKKGQNVIVDTRGGMKLAKKRGLCRKYHKWIDDDGNDLTPKRKTDNIDSVCNERGSSSIRDSSEGLEKREMERH